jgi:hypothetical protein
VKTFHSLIASDGVGIDPIEGLVKAAGYDEMIQQANVQSWNIDNTQVYWAADNVAILTYRWTGKATMGGQGVPSPTWASTTWVNSSGKWQAVFHQETLASAPAKKPTH